jgi:chemotaxis protein methyltransferase CheR
MFVTEGPPKLSFEEFKLIREFIYRHCGLFFPDDNSFLVESRLAPRVQHLGLKRFQDYYLYLRFHKQRETELEACIDALTTNETYFFREQPQLRAFSEEIVDKIRREKLAAGNRSLRIWSAGCSTGEEPYTIAMLLLEMEVFSTWRVEVIGTDISQRVLQAARQGIYGPNAFRTTEARYQDKYFEPLPGGKYRIRENVRRLVSFGHLNLLDRKRIGLLQPVDIIFCRNVIIYFDNPIKRQVVESFYDKLVPGGYLLLGHSESLMNVSTAFTLEHLRHDLVYRKPGGA